MHSTTNPRTRPDKRPHAYSGRRNRVPVLAIAVASLLLLTTSPVTSLTPDPAAGESVLPDRSDLDPCAHTHDALCGQDGDARRATEDQDGAKNGDPTAKDGMPGGDGQAHEEGTDRDGARHPAIPRGFPGHYHPPESGEVFAPGEYHVVCVPRSDGTDHFVVDRDSLRILEFVTGDLKVSEHGFVAASCDLPWDLPWPSPPRDEDASPPLPFKDA